MFQKSIFVTFSNTTISRSVVSLAQTSWRDWCRHASRRTLEILTDARALRKSGAITRFKDGNNKWDIDRKESLEFC